ncbi:MAG: 16S rRNA processing protein RimM [Odoribacter sp.]|nr:16S rRNA processing protein RimM [Odoribacter sp.]
MITREDCRKIGEVTKTHGLQGAVIVTTDYDLTGQYAGIPVFLLLEGAPVPFFMAENGIIPRNRTSYIIRFDYVDSLTEAEYLVGAEVMLEKDLLEDEEPEEDIFKLIGFEVEDSVSGKTGHVADVVDYSGNVVLTLSMSGKEILLPLSEIYISELDSDRHRLRVNIPSELAELN